MRESVPKALYISEYILQTMPRKKKKEPELLGELCSEAEALLEGIEDLTAPTLGNDAAICEMRDRILDILDQINRGDWK